jgi:NTE family protein
MLQELVNRKGLDFQIIRGVSVGALNASFLSQAPMVGDSLSELKKKVDDLNSLWRDTIKGNYSVYAERGSFLALAAGADSLYSLEPLRSLINTRINLEAIRNSGRDFKVGTVSLVSGQYSDWGATDVHFIEKVVASASIPVVFPYVDLKDKRDVLVDGGVRNISPLSSAFEAEPDEIYVLLTSKLVRRGSEFPDSGVQAHDYEQWDDNWLGTKVNGLDVLKRTIEILTDEIYLDDIRGALHWNEVAKSIEALKRSSRLHQLPEDTIKAIDRVEQSLKDVKKRYVPLYVIAPQEWYGDENKSTEFSPSLIDQAIEHGRMIAADPRKWVWPVQ